MCPLPYAMVRSWQGHQLHVIKCFLTSNQDYTHHQNRLAGPLWMILKTRVANSRVMGVKCHMFKCKVSTTLLQVNKFHHKERWMVWKKGNSNVNVNVNHCKHMNPASLENLLVIRHWKIYKSTTVVDLHCSFTDIGWLHRAHMLIMNIRCQIVERDLQLQSGSLLNHLFEQIQRCGGVCTLLSPVDDNHVPCWEYDHVTHAPRNRHRLHAPKWVCICDSHPPTSGHARQLGGGVKVGSSLWASTD